MYIRFETRPEEITHRTSLAQLVSLRRALPMCVPFYDRPHLAPSRLSAFQILGTDSYKPTSGCHQMKDWHGPTRILGQRVFLEHFSPTANSNATASLTQPKPDDVNEANHAEEKI
ncbi:hypothetical protein ZHAS_00008548 [Anopheles sinensis]|uniref:Uncharacterized protein n=1 Tax=Anopheles sinensis TaxID=74873 RepID=A0A084VSZ7_ANOSI|nr:hypothetical protein ZHAS_00008548 [Anopheles sinensis]